MIVKFFICLLCELILKLLHLVSRDVASPVIIACPFQHTLRRWLMPHFLFSTLLLCRRVRSTSVASRRDIIQQSLEVGVDGGSVGRERQTLDGVPRALLPIFDIVITW